MTLAEYKAMARGYWERARAKEKEAGRWVAILCQAQGVKVTAVDLVGETQDERRQREKAERKREKKLAEEARKSLRKWREKDNGK